MRLDPASAAQWALVALALVMMGAILTTGIVSIEQRAVVLSGIVAVLGAIAWRQRRHHDDDTKE